MHYLRRVARYAYGMEPAVGRTDAYRGAAAVTATTE